MIKKKEYEIENKDLKVNRMPFIEIGIADRFKQVEELLFQLAPVSNDDLATEYEERYGVRTDTVLANFFTKIDVYLHDGIYDVEQKELLDEKFSMMKYRLKEDFYLWEEVYAIFEREFPGESLDVINPMTLKKLGFKVFSQYVIRDIYPSADAYFKSLLYDKDFIIVEELPDGIRKQQFLYTIINDLRDELHIIEVERNKYVSFEYFQNNYVDISKEEFVEIGRNAIKYVTTEFFTAYNLLKNGLEIDYGPMKNPYILGSSIRLITGVKSIRLLNNVLHTTTQNEFQSDMLKYFISEKSYFRLDDLVSFLIEEYDLEYNRRRLACILQNIEGIGYDGMNQIVYSEDKIDIGEMKWYSLIYEEILRDSSKSILKNNTMITKVFWEDKYLPFIDFCGEQGVFTIADFLAYDLRCLYDNEDKCFSKNLISNAIIKLEEWLLANQNDDMEKEEVSLFDCFFK